MKLPTFFIVGAAKSGTTSLASYLRQHPEVFISASKEPNFFALEGLDLPPRGPAPPEVLTRMLYNWSRIEREAYHALFEAADRFRAVGEASVRYLYFEEAPPRIREALPEARIVVMLRDPVSRLYSHYNMNRQILLEPLPLEGALEAEASRIAAGWGWDWHYAALGRYACQLRRYYERFPRAQIGVWFHDDFGRDPLAVYAEICRHIGVDPAHRPDMRERGMVSSLPRSRALARFLWWPSRFRARLIRNGGRLGRAAIDGLKRLNAAPVPPLDRATRDRLARDFLDDIAELEGLIGRRVPWYREMRE